MLLLVPFRPALYDRERHDLAEFFWYRRGTASVIRTESQFLKPKFISLPRIILQLDLSECLDLDFTS
jgi:hypothetical protein